MLSRLIVVALALCLAGCLISEQEGQLVPAGNPQMVSHKKLGDVTYHFNSTFNKVIVFARTAALLLFAFWLFQAFRGSTVPMVIALVCVVVAGWLLFRDLRTVFRYRVHITEENLSMNVPPGPAREIDWAELEALVIEGREWQMGSTNRVTKRRDYFTDLPEWKSMEVRLSSGEGFVFDLSRLSVEHRQSLWRAIVMWAQLVKEE